MSRCQLSYEEQLEMFLEGLKGNNKRLIMVLSPKNLQQAITYANALSVEENPYKGGGRKDEHTYGAQRNQSRLPAPARNIIAHANRTTVFQLPHKRFTSAKLDEKGQRDYVFGATRNSRLDINAPIGSCIP